MKEINFESGKNLLLRWAPDQGDFTEGDILG